jgi:hypothetical protein
LAQIPKIVAQQFRTHARAKVLDTRERPVKDNFKISPQPGNNKHTLPLRLRSGFWKGGDMKSGPLEPRTTKRFLSTTLFVLLFSVPLFAQGNFGRILGSVKDSTGAVLPGASISVIDTQRGLARTVTSDEAGLYNAPTLTPGTYTVRVEFPGFKTLFRENVVVEVGSEIRVDLAIEPGQQSEAVTVNEAIPLVDTTSGTLGGVLENAAINDMPLNGRNYQNLLNLIPGVMIQPGGSPWTQSSNNTRPDETVFMVDGVFNANYVDRRPIANMPSPFTDGATILPIDAIQEFKLEENPKAEYGGLAGAVVNVGIRTGTNLYHGSAYAFGRSDRWAARNYFNPSGPKQPTELEQFGGVVGGPIMKDRLFFFGGYEGLRSFVGNALGMLVPATGSLGGDPVHSMVDALNVLQASGVTPSPVSLKLMGCTPAPPYACTGGLIQNAPAKTTTYNSGFPNTNASDNEIGKIDYRLNSKHSLNGMVLIGNYLGNGEDHPITAKYWQNGNPIRTYTVTSNWIWTASPRVLNDFRFGFSNPHQTLVPNDANLSANGKDYPLNTGITSTGGFPSVDISPGFGNGILGSWRGRPQQYNNPVFDFQDNLSYLWGKHSFKFGGEFAHIHTDYNLHDTRGRIQFRGKQTFAGSTSLEDFFAGKPAKAFQLVGPTLRQMNWTSTAAFFQDDWRIAPRFMLNLGLRWSFVSPFKEANGLLGGFDPLKGLVQQGQPGYDSVFKPDYKNFSPRVGFNWDITGKGTTVLRGGSSVVYSMYTPAQFMQSNPQSFAGGAISLVPTGACTVAVAPGVKCPSTFGGTITTGNAVILGSFLDWNNVVFPKDAGFSCTPGSGACSIVTMDPNLKYPYVVNWNIGIQHAFTNDLSLDVSYVANHGDRLSGRRDINMADPVTGVRPYDGRFPYLKFIDQTQNFVRSNYNSLQATLTQRFSRGVSFKAGYTYGHGLDSGSLNRFALTPQDSRYPGLEYASSDSDVRHRLTITGSYEIPGIKGYAQLLQGWKLNTIVNIQTSQPWNVDDTGNDFSGTGELADRWNFYGNPKDFRSGGSGIGYCDFSNGSAAVICSRQSQVSGISTSLPASVAQRCLSVAPDLGTLHDGGCYVSGNSVMVPPKAGTFGTMGRNIFRDSGFKNVDLSVFKTFKFSERYSAQFRAEFFNLFNHPIIANPYGSANGSQLGWDPSSPGAFGSGSATPDVAAGNPLVGSGSSRVMQLGLKLTF